MSSIESDLIKINKIPVETIDEYLTKNCNNVIHWAITGVDNDYYEINISYTKNTI